MFDEWFTNILAMEIEVFEHIMSILGLEILRMWMGADNMLEVIIVSSSDSEELISSKKFEGLLLVFYDR